MATDDKGFTSMDEKMRKKAAEMADKDKTKKSDKKETEYPGTPS